MNVIASASTSCCQVNLASSCPERVTSFLRLYDTLYVLRVPFVFYVPNKLFTPTKGLNFDTIRKKIYVVRPVS